MQTQLLDADLSGAAIGAFYEVYNQLGFGFLENVYAAAMEAELRERGYNVARECNVTVQYKEKPIAWQRLDLLLESRLIIEVKAGHKLQETAMRQLRSYLRATDIEVGLLFHFGPEPRFFRVIAQRRFGVERRHPKRPVQCDPGYPAIQDSQSDKKRGPLEVTAPSERETDP